MIEVEKNFDLRSGDKERLIAGANLVSKKTFTDVYWDSPDYRLTAKDYWLRQRDGKWELKVPMNSERIDKRATDQYRELETEEEIIAELKLAIGSRVHDAVRSAGYAPLATIVTHRETYQKDGFHLDFDEMDFGYTTFEAELMVQNPEEVQGAEKRIMEFARAYDIAATASHGKVIEYLFRYKPEHYSALVKSGVVRAGEKSTEGNPRSKGPPR